MERHPDYFEEAKRYEKTAIDYGSPFTWSQGESLERSWRGRSASLRSGKTTSDVCVVSERRVRPTRSARTPSLSTSTICMARPRCAWHVISSYPWTVHQCAGHMTTNCALGKQTLTRFQTMLLESTGCGIRRRCIYVGKAEAQPIARRLGATLAREPTILSWRHGCRLRGRSYA